MFASNKDQAFDVLTKCDVDLVLLDLGLSTQDATAGSDPLCVPAGGSVRKTELLFDHAPPAARKYAAGQRILEQMHSRVPDVPVYLFSLEQNSTGLPGTAIDEELLVACVRAGGARGAIRTSLGGLKLSDLEAERTALTERVLSLTSQLRKEKFAAELAKGSQVVSFVAAPAISPDGARLQIRCRNFRLIRALRSADSAAVVSDAERPATRFDDVIGAKSTKEALLFIRDWLQDPKPLRRPRGLIHRVVCC